MTHLQLFIKLIMEATQAVSSWLQPTKTLHLKNTLKLQRLLILVILPDSCQCCLFLFMRLYHKSGEPPRKFREATEPGNCEGTVNRGRVNGLW